MIGDIGAVIAEANSGDVAYPLGRVFAWISVTVAVGVPLAWFGWRWVLRGVLVIGSLYFAVVGVPWLAIAAFNELVPSARGTWLIAAPAAAGFAAGYWIFNNAAPRLFEAIEALIQPKDPPA